MVCCSNSRVVRGSPVSLPVSPPMSALGAQHITARCGPPCECLSPQRPTKTRVKTHGASCIGTEASHRHESASRYRPCANATLRRDRVSMKWADRAMLGRRGFRHSRGSISRDTSLKMSRSKSEHSARALDDHAGHVVPKWCTGCSSGRVEIFLLKRDRSLASDTSSGGDRLHTER